MPVATAPLPLFGSDVPFAEPLELRGHVSPYYNEHHVRWRQQVRDFVDKELAPFADEWDEAGDVTDVEQVRRRCYDAGIFAALWPREYGGTPPEGSEGDWHGASATTRVDPFFDLILQDELARVGAGGVNAAIFGGSGIGLPPILAVASDEIKAKVARAVVTGEKTICLNITEPTGGSDVSAIKTTATREGDFWVVNGAKKWITGGLKADFFTVVCRTDPKSKGGKGLSMLLLERGMPGLTVRRMKTQGWWASNTTFVEFDNVRVPLGNLIGEEGMGFMYTMLNFNHERFIMAVSMVRFSRLCLEDAVIFARRRKTFGKRLIDHQVIKHKIIDMGRRIEGSHRMVEHYTNQVKCGVPDMQLGAYIAMLKVDASRLMEYCAREASQILGGACFTRDGGAGSRIERIYREVRVNAIGGGSEEVMMNLAASMSKL